MHKQITFDKLGSNFLLRQTCAALSGNKCKQLANLKVLCLTCLYELFLQEMEVVSYGCHIWNDTTGELP